jgi:hypothetical protein
MSTACIHRAVCAERRNRHIDMPNQISQAILRQAPQARAEAATRSQGQTR